MGGRRGTVKVNGDLICIARFDGYFKKNKPAVSAALGYFEKAIFALPIITFIHPDDREITSHRRGTLSGGSHW